MTDKFEKAIKEQTYICPIEPDKQEIRGINFAAKECNIIHQQAMKEKVKGVLQEFQNATYNNKVISYIIREIAKENNIEL